MTLVFAMQLHVHVRDIYSRRYFDKVWKICNLCSTLKPPKKYQDYIYIHVVHGSFKKRVSR